MTIRVLVADDQALIRGGLVALFTAAPGFKAVGEAENGAQAVALVAQTRPDVVLMDVRMPVLDGIGATRQILSAPGEHRPRVVVLTTFDVDEYVYTALAEGASGFLLKDTPPPRILSALQAIVAGDVLLAPGITARLVRTYGQQQRARPVRHPRLDELTARETEVLGLVAGGLSNTEIAGRLVLSEETVKTHVKRIMSKLQLTSRAQAVVVAYESGLTSPTPLDEQRPPR